MRASLTRFAATILVALLFVACATATSPVPVMTASPIVASSAPSQSPAASPQAGGFSITAIAAGHQHTCALTSVGGVKCWGALGSGQIDPGTTERGSTTPVDVSGLTTGVAAITAGDGHTCALMSGGGVKCWGANGAGQLGNGTTADSNATPVDVSGLSSDAIAIAAGGAHTCAVMRGGGVKCWGSNTYGQLGTGTTIDSSIPVDVSGLADEVDALAAGLLNTCALTSGGGVKCWGYAAPTGLADSPTTQSLVPIDVAGLGSGVTAIAAGYELACALTTLGGVKCWGRNYGGQLGDGTTTESSTVVDVAGLGSGVSAISVGFGGHACALTAGGAVKCWGSDWHGQLGDGPDSQSLVPADVSGLESGVRAISAGAEHTCALARDGQVKCWGDNWYGQLGGGTPCDSSDVPVSMDFAPPPSSSPTDAPREVLNHATGPTDVVFRFGDGAVVGVGELDGERFEPGPAFTLYGDGTVIFWWARAELPPTEGPILRGGPFGITHLDEDEIQALLRFALDEGGLGEACERYETRDTDVAESFVFTVRAGGVDTRVEGPGPNRFPELADHLLNIDRIARFPTRVWVPDRYWGNLLTADPWIELGILPDPRAAGLVPWPWPGIAPEEFAGIADDGWASAGRRVMSSAEAAVLDLSDNGGVVARVYLLGPDGVTIYSFSLWPMLPDESS